MRYTAILLLVWAVGGIGCSHQDKDLVQEIWEVKIHYKLDKTTMPDGTVIEQRRPDEKR